MSKLHVYGALARALHFQNLRRLNARRLECNRLGVIARFIERWM